MIHSEKIQDITAKKEGIQINVHNEWDPLEEVIVGIADNARFPLKDTIFNERWSEGRFEMPVLPEYIIEETNEDLAIFSEALEKLGIIVHRPTPMNPEKMITTPDWTSDQLFNYCPRDLILVLGNKILETPSCDRPRFFETFSYRDILLQAMESGCPWIAAPKPRLRDTDYPINTNSTFRDPVFDAANILKAGKDLFYLVSESGNLAGLKWLRNFVGDEYRVHACPGIYGGYHIDSSLVLLRPGLVLANPERVNEKNLPEPLKQWEIIYAPPMEEYTYSNLPGISSAWLGMNLLPLSPELAVVDEHQVGLIKLLKKKGIDVLPLRIRHGRSLAGGFHCATLGLRRKGEKMTYFDASKF